MKQPVAKSRRWIPSRFPIGLGLTLCALTVSCGHFQNEQESAPARKAPTPSEANAHVEFKPLGEQAVGKVLVTSARVAWDENRVAHVFPPVTGRVVEIAAQLGDFVKKGQRLATIMSPDLGSAVADMNKARAALTAADHDVKRQRELFKLHAVSAAVLEASEDNYAICLAEMQRAEQKAALLREAGVDSVTQTYKLYSPLDGQVLARQINPGMEVQGMYSGGATVELYTVGMADALWVLADVYEQDMARVKVGAPVEVRTVAYPDKPTKGTIDWVADALDPATRTVTVRCTLDNEGRFLKPHMYATVLIETEGKSTLAIPRDSLVHLGEKTLVITADLAGDRFERRPIVVDESETGDWVPVLHGVVAGEEVVTKGALLLSEAIN
jgi:cobalt-zinc-cadmium efflux system membrane fusion protein